MDIQDFIAKREHKDSALSAKGNIVDVKRIT